MEETAEYNHPSHALRYEFAKERIGKMAVIDVGCGTGFGSAILAQSAKSVVGIDNDPRVIAVAKERYAHIPNLSFQVGDVREFPFTDNAFDAAVAFEVIEHFYAQDVFLTELKRIIKDDGTVIISTPDHTANLTIGVYSPQHEGHGHAKELTLPEFLYLMNHYFDHTHFYGQMPYGKPSKKDKIVNFAKRADILKLRKLIPQKTRNRHNLSVRMYDAPAEITKLREPMLDMIAVGTNKK